mmetsp:Transcript_16350/g.51963  ORF Transcript_16350/g.51963 Transcript_16350/m.51963 type:complete len:267 (+) Transcript_16350:57-857(+)|eukprot:CAMPEP_0196774266 /NCGR_PEP_ID=MMETSP1104-20130614/3283_1 /TAXON_ID=33652 /ORGANISM="Cafeteria sp., Strain Caron Lab Isolate" /LENGTH=266 /DNA_ID=CAMNT_0042144419 /DNA_START=17 /DNA_END=817 /DNA_ORIENTATION=+
MEQEEYEGHESGSAAGNAGKVAFKLAPRRPVKHLRSAAAFAQDRASGDEEAKDSGSIESGSAAKRRRGGPDGAPAAMADVAAAGAPDGSDAQSIADGQAQAQEEFDKGVAAAEAGRWEEAQRRLHNATLLEPGNARWWEAKAQVEMELGEPFQAIQSAERACACDPSWFVSLWTLGRAQRNFGEAGMAAESLDKALRLCGQREPEMTEMLHELRELKSILGAAGGEGPARFAVVSNPRPGPGPRGGPGRGGAAPVSTASVERETKE